jgi:PAS domain S-box-containing protein
MSTQQSWSSIVSKLKLTTNASFTEEEFLSLQTSVDSALAEAAGASAHNQKMLELGYQEMEKMWATFEHRELLIKAIFDASQDIIITLDHLGQIIEFNQTFLNMMKLDGGSIAGKDIFSILHEGDFTKFLKLFFDKDSTKDVGELLGNQHELILIGPNEEDIEVSLNISKVQNGATAIYPLYIKDLRAEKAAFRAIEESRSQLLSASKMSALGEMAGGVAHEINTPLAIIQMRADQILEGLDDETIDKELFRNALNAIDLTVKRIGKIVYGLRSFARDGSKDALMPHAVSSIVEDTFSLCREKFSSHGVKLDFINEKDSYISCRPGEISQVLLNLINNSYDAVQNLPEQWVKVELTEDTSMVKIKVSDSGSGIPMDIQNKMMHPFFTTKEIGKGTGLGLSISRGIMKAHGGSLYIDNSNPNTTFCLELPKAIAKSV